MSCRSSDNIIVLLVAINLISELRCSYRAALFVHVHDCIRFFNPTAQMENWEGLSSTEGKQGACESGKEICDV